MTGPEMKQQLDQAYGILKNIVGQYAGSEGADPQISEMIVEIMGSMDRLEARVDFNEDTVKLSRNSLKMRKEAVQINLVTPVAPVTPTNTKNYEQKRDELMQQQQKQRKTQDAPGKSFKERLEDQLRMFYD